MIQLGADGVFVDLTFQIKAGRKDGRCGGSCRTMITDLSRSFRDLGEAMPGLEISTLGGGRMRNAAGKRLTGLKVDEQIQESQLPNLTI